MTIVTCVNPGKLLSHFDIIVTNSKVMSKAEKIFEWWAAFGEGL
ncbi:hypothetical protein pah_c254o012 [Parachlamydia acanthamoebae str. Hall's coccus]|nr:hypothetical protein pah_c254o012 [Parachlamydia acanthamoebae str. Hall's coccus]